MHNAPNIVSAKLCWHLDCRMTLQCPARRWHVWCWSRVWPEHCSSHQHSILRQLPGDSHSCHYTIYILHSTYLVSCVLYLNQTWTWTRTSHVQKHLSKPQYFAADGKKCLRMLWKWLDRTEVNLIMYRWLFCGNIVDDLKTCWDSALLLSWYISI